MLTLNPISILASALFMGAALFLPASASAGSCCGGGGGSSLVLPEFYSGMIDVCADYEKYDGFWNETGKYTPDPPGSDLRQYRLNMGYAQRISSNWQASILVPYVWNSNEYSGFTSRTDGIGDTSLNIWYEALEDKSAWKIRTVKDLTPSTTIGPSLLIPTGISPYDNVSSSFDVTGRGFYRIDGNVIIAKTLHPFTASLSYSYGIYLERPVNREYGKYVEPYHKKLGDRTFASASIGYIVYFGTGGDTLTATASYNHLREADAMINGATSPESGFMKESLGASIAYSGTDRDWTFRAGWNHAIKRDRWGENFPATDIYTIGVSYGFR